MYLVNDYDYVLPEELIAQQSEKERDRSRLLTLNAATGAISHGVFNDVAGYFNPGDVLVLNNTRVIPARLFGRKASGGNCEVLVADYAGGVNDGQARTFTCQCLVKASKRPKPGAVLHFDEDLTAEVLETGATASLLKFSYQGSFEDTLEKIGRIPLPHYIKRDYGADDQAGLARDKTAYQTVFAKHNGAVAAPTAGLHFTPGLLAQIEAQGVKICYVTLHVGYGTFAPVRVSDIRQHQMHSERFKVNAATANAINAAKAGGRKITAVGTTTVRTLEYIAKKHGQLQEASGQCDVFIYPGFEFKVVDNIITNFHLPKSTLMMLVSAFSGKDNVFRAYEEAVRQRYRFFSYGDAMFIKGGE